MRFGPGERRWTRIFRSDPRPEVDEELAFHLEQRVRDYEAQGMTPDEARAAARRRLGDLSDVRTECAELLTSERRTEARRQWLNVSWLDFKLGLRMLVKYPGLTLIGGLAIAFAICVGTVTFEVLRQAVYPSLPLPDGDRIVVVEVMDAEAGALERRTVREFAEWKQSLRSIEELGAWRALQRNLVVEGAEAEPVQVTEITASAFRVARAVPLLGRTLEDADERADAPAVAVLGHDVWQERFGGDRDVVGRAVSVGGQPVTIVGVMPDGYGFPLAQNFWVPLRLNPLEYERRTGPSVIMFGRLAEGVSLEEAQTELKTVGEQLAQALPASHASLRPRAMPLGESFLRLSTVESLIILSINAFIVMLLVLICANVALLMFARAAARESEIAVRNALGASRGRIVMQLFAEALVLGGVGAFVGIAVAVYALRQALDLARLETVLPFWFTDRLSPTTIGYALLLTLLAAAIAGILPAFRVTRGLQARLRAAGGAGGGAPNFGGVWTAVIVTQVALTVAFPAVGLLGAREMVELELFDVGFPSHEFLTARVEMDPDAAGSASTDTTAAAFEARFNRSWEELEAELIARPEVAAVSYANRLPRMYHPHRLIEIDEGGAAPLHPAWPAYRVSNAHVDPALFETLGVPIVAGRPFHATDATSDNGYVLVNEAFVERVLGSRNPIGRRLRYVHYEETDDEAGPDGRPQRWYEIIGVTKNTVPPDGMDPKVATIFHAATPAAAYPVRIAIHTRAGEPERLAQELRSAAARVNPGLRIYEPVALDRVNQDEIRFYMFWLKLNAALSLLVLTLSVAALYAVMAFTVSRRTREIGVRVALGSSRTRIVAAVLRRPLLQLVCGIMVGVMLMVLIGLAAEGAPGPRMLLQITAVATAMLLACLTASIVPAWRALRIQPMEALRSD